MDKLKGKLIVIDGTDGSGKATQTELLAKRLKRAGFEVEIADFPQYGKKSAGAVEAYLNGKYGSAEEVGPYRASLLYAIDRYDAGFQIKRWLGEGKIVLSNRYVAANMAHQGGKISNALERKNFYAWINKLEYGLFAIPKPDLNIILHLEAAAAQKLIEQKGERRYLNGAKKDLHENDLEHLLRAERTYLEIAKSFPNFVVIECQPQGRLETIEKINDLIWREMSRLIGLTPVMPDKRSDDDNSSVGNRPTLKVRRFLPAAKLPARAEDGDGLDLFAAEDCAIMPGEKITITTGLSLRVPKRHIGLVVSSHNLLKEGVRTVASLIDSQYRSELKINFINSSARIHKITAGQKIARLLIQKTEPINISEN